jgi:hypothetical protein
MRESELKYMAENGHTERLRETADFLELVWETAVIKDCEHLERAFAAAMVFEAKGRGLRRKIEGE